MRDWDGKGMIRDERKAMRDAGCERKKVRW